MVFESISTTPHFFDLLIYTNWKKHIDKAQSDLLDRFDKKQEREYFCFMDKMILERENKNK